MNRDQKSFDMYSLVIGALALGALGIYVGVTILSDRTQGVYTVGTATYQSAVQDRIRPLGQVYLPGEEIRAGQLQAVEAVRPEPVAAVSSGAHVYDDACLMCHGSGIGGTPTLDDQASWAPRIAQGNDALYQNAIEGFTGQTGFMPPKGARMDLSDDEIRDAVDYMVSEVGN